MAERKQYVALNIVKFIMAMLILTQHTSNEWAHSTGLIHDFFGLGNFAVPFFFACSGFLFFTKFNTLDYDEQKEYYKKWSVRIAKMYLVWSLIYFCFVFAGWTSIGFSSEAIISYFHRAIVFSTYSTIWFLPALWVGLSICYWMKRHCSMRVTWITMILLMIIGNLFGSYSNILTQQLQIASFYEWYMDIFITWRNGLFNGAPFVFIGILMAHGSAKKLPLKVSVLLSILFSFAFLLEAFAITRYKLSSATDMGFMMVPAIFFIMHYLINVDIKNRPLWKHCRNLSMLIFLSQRLFLTAIFGVLPDCIGDTVQSWPQLAIFLFFIVIVLGFSISVEKLSDKYKFLKILW